jgi:hypothetical protein
VYCGKNEDIEEMVRIAQKEARLIHKVVFNLVANIQRKWHTISMDNFFTFVGLFEELASMQNYVTGTIRSNRIGLPLALKNRGTFKNIPYNTLK